MRTGEGFARRVILANLEEFAPLLAKSSATKGRGTGADSANQYSTDSANHGASGDRELAEAEARFNGKSIKTGIRFPRPTRGHPRPPSGPRGRGLRVGQAKRTGPEEVLLMRVKPRRNGKQLQISIKVHRSPFMNGAREVVSSADGSRRAIGKSVTSRSNAAGKKRGKAPNTVRFEAPEMKGMSNPVARFKWVSDGASKGAANKILQYEIFDAVGSSDGRKIYKKLEQGIAKQPTTRLGQLSRDETVLSKPDRKSAQWYRLDSV